MVDRQLGILYLLLSRSNVTAAQLAERFEVSVRTIYRDIDSLSLAGFPVYARQGKNGGISLMENFVLNRMLLTKQEQESILAGLASMQETGAGDEEQMAEKLAGFFRMERENWVSIDFSDWSGRRKELYGLIKKAVLEHRLLRFDYYGQYHEMSERTVEPVQLLFREYTWYLRAYCHSRKAIRLFKIMRMTRTACLEETFLPDPRRYAEAEEDRQPAADRKQPEEIAFRVAASEAWRIYDRFEEEEITVQEDGSFLIRMKTEPDEWVYGLLLSFGPALQVIGPEHVKEEILRRIGKMAENYGASFFQLS